MPIVINDWAAINQRTLRYFPNPFDLDLELWHPRQDSPQASAALHARGRAGLESL